MTSEVSRETGDHSKPYCTKDIWTRAYRILSVIQVSWSAVWIMSIFYVTSAFSLCAFERLPYFSMYYS